MYKILYLPTGNFVFRFKDADDSYPFNSKGYTLDYSIDHISEFDDAGVAKFFRFLTEWNTKAPNSIFPWHFDIMEVKDA
jgi:hypothetical protein